MTYTVSSGMINSTALAALVHDGMVWYGIPYHHVRELRIKIELSDEIKLMIHTGDKESER